ncbi:MAG: PAS domain S-box protein, partial [Chitinivibrionales bacterium]|nr:PAS domain S-box protein [Chitinivibrionales bacterium]MBD3355915.1 PAS domain S-box protein [Chitinivibrionales bacterium]
MKRFRDLPIKGKIVAIVVGTTFVILAAGLALVIIYSAISGRNQLAASAEKNAELASEYALVPLAFGDTAQAEKNLSSLRTLPAVKKAVIFGDDGKPFAVYRADGGDPPSLDLREHYSEFLGGYYHVFRPIARDGSTYGTLYLAVSTAELTHHLRDSIIFFSTALLVLVIVAFLLASVSQKTLTEPLRRLAEVMGTVRGNPDNPIRIDWPNDDEIGQLYRGFNAMLVRIEEAQKELRKNEAKHRTIIASMSDVIFVVARDNRLVEVYGDLGDIVNARPGDLIGKAIGEIIPHELVKEFEQKAETVRENGEGRQLEYELELDGKKRWFLSNLDLHEDGAGLVVTIRDITERKALIERLNQSEKMEAVGLLAGGVAHDFNNMLVGIMSSAELLKGVGYDDLDAREEFLGMITGSAARAADLTGKLLAFARKGKLETAPLDINQTITDAITLLQRSVDKRITITANFRAAKRIVCGDLTQLQNVFLNLGINAAHAMPEGGEISFLTSNPMITEEHCRNSVFDLTPGEYVAIEVRDTGCGIPAEHMAHIFEPFFTTKEKGRGTGLGLAAVYGTVTEHKGEITVASEKDVGTVFTIRLPLYVIEEKDDEEGDEELVYGKGRIL